MKGKKHNGAEAKPSKIVEGPDFDDVETDAMARKRGGKVEGEKAKKRLDRAPRKCGGRAERKDGGRAKEA